MSMGPWDGPKADALDPATQSDVGGGKVTDQVSASSNLIVSTGWTDVPGLSFTTPQAGDWLVTVIFDVIATASGGTLLGGILVDGSAASGNIVVIEPTNGSRGMHSQQWHIEGLASGKIIKAIAIRIAGAYQVVATHSRLTCQQVG